MSEDISSTKIWANSRDSHLMEPPNLFDGLPHELRDLQGSTTGAGVARC
jgi:hypothetical protein